VSAPAPAVRATTYERDEHRCVSCGATTGLQWQHRRATGMGGSEVRPGLEDGLTSCALCNPAYEGALQKRALRFGWKVRRWVKHPEHVPVFYQLELRWYVLDGQGRRHPISRGRARGLMEEVYGPEYDEWEDAA
jgi:hypothetical protein